MRKKILYTCLFVLALMTVGCSSDDSGMETTAPVPAPNDKVAVQLHIAPAGSSKNMRATWQDTNATDDEMMNIWVVVITDNVNAVEKVIACKPTGTEREVDPIVELPLGVHNFYSFANMSVEKVKEILGISVTMPTMTDNDVVYEATAVSGTVDANKNVRVDGNQFAKFATTDDNGFGSYGIPMSNVQTYTIASSGSYDLVVVRMMAKIQLQIKNSTGASVTVKSATLSNVTKNSTGNLKLLPTLTQHDTMEPTHGDITPNLGTAVQEDLTIAINKAIANDATENVTFYVNECGAPDNPEGLFYLTLEMDNSGTSEYRYALIDQTGATTADDNKWAYIARNDYRIIPIQLDDLKFEIIPYDFPAIGVYPVSVKEVDATNHVYDFEFHDYGHFHLLPSVTKSGTAVEFSATTPTGTGYKWTLVGDDFANSWFTASTKGGVWVTTNTDIEALDFYRTGYSVTPPVDGDEVGGIPVWYVNDGSDGPRWAPDATNYRPFIFGYIEDPGSATKKQVYHEMKIQVYNGTVAYRQMLYRFYMTLSADQMLYSRSFRAAAPRHSHGY